MLNNEGLGRSSERSVNFKFICGIASSTNANISSVFKYSGTVNYSRRAREFCYVTGRTGVGDGGSTGSAGP